MKNKEVWTLMAFLIICILAVVVFAPKTAKGEVTISFWQDFRFVPIFSEYQEVPVYDNCRFRIIHQPWPGYRIHHIGYYLVAEDDYFYPNTFESFLYGEPYEIVICPENRCGFYRLYVNLYWENLRTHRLHKESSSVLLRLKRPQPPIIIERREVYPDHGIIIERRGVFHDDIEIERRGSFHDNGFIQERPFRHHHPEPKNHIKVEAELRLEKHPKHDHNKNDDDDETSLTNRKIGLGLLGTGIILGGLGLLFLSNGK